MLHYVPRSAGVLALAVVAFLAILPLRAQGRAEPVLLKSITPALRARIDKTAMGVELEDLGKESVNLAGNATAFLISQTTLTAQEEANLAEQMHQKLLKTKQVVETPKEAERILKLLLAQVPAQEKPKEFTYRLTVLDVPELGVFTFGGGCIYITRPALERLLDGTPRGESALAFVLAQQLGHIGRLHCRRGWQLAQIQEELKQHFKTEVDANVMCRLLETSVQFSGPLTYFLYSRHQSYEADLYAWQLCRNARIDMEEALDALRYGAIMAHPRAATEEDYRPAKDELAPVLRYYLSESPDPLLRLKRMLMERDGLVEDVKEYGLFRYDFKSGAFTRCADQSVAADAAPIVFIHGLRDGNTAFQDFLAFLGKQKETADRPLLVFRYPNNDSLARCGLFLTNEVKRVLAAPEKAAFICHSAGGLVFRFYAEIKKGAFGQAFLLGTPHLGSQLTALKFLIDVTQFAGALRLGLPGAIAATVPEGRGAIGYDLLPDSLFLRYLGYDKALAARYQIFYGQCLDPVKSLSLSVAVRTARTLLKEVVTAHIQSPVLREQANRVIDELQAPQELLNGDGVVTVRSASLKNAGKITKTTLDHLSIKSDEKVMQQILGVLIKQ
jgi:Zn-dependent protease with chaperone function